MTHFDFDTETFLLSPGRAAPPLVCLQFCVDGGAPQITHARDPACQRTVEWALQTAQWSGHNVAFDLCVLMAAYPDLVPEFFRALDADQITCTLVRQKLLEIATGRYKKLAKSGGYSLDGVARRLGLDLTINKDDPWRLKYGTLYHTDVDQWPADATHYARMDATAQRDIRCAQDAYAARKNPELSALIGHPVDALADQHRQTRAAVWMRLMECRGIMVDPVRVESYIAEVRAGLERDRKVAQAAGLVRPDGTRDTRAATLRMVELCERTEEPELPITATGLEILEKETGLDSWGLWRRELEADRAKIEAKRADWMRRQAKSKRQLKPLPHREPCGQYIALNEDACDLYGDAELEAYQRCGVAATQIARAERLRYGTTTPIQSSFQTLIDTGRTACRQGDVKAGVSPPAWGAQLQNPAKDKKSKSTGELVRGTRECFVARPGFVFCSVDYNSMELCGVSQICVWVLGYSKLGEVINEGRDAHTELAATLAGISAEEGYARRRGERGALEKKVFDNEHRQTAKVGNFGFWGGMGAPKMVLAARKQYGVRLGVTPDDAPDAQVPWDRALAASQKLKRAWQDTWDETRPYFKWINGLMSGRETTTIQQFVSGRVRGGCWYTQAANTFFQGLCADIAKDALWQITREMYADPRSPLFGSRMVNFLHDESFTELREDRAHEAAHRIAEIQVDVARKWAPDLKWGAEPALMPRWYKAADAVYAVPGPYGSWDYWADGKPCKRSTPGAILQPWTPELAAKLAAGPERKAA